MREVMGWWEGEETERGRKEKGIYFDHVHMCPWKQNQSGKDCLTMYITYIHLPYINREVCMSFTSININWH